MKKHFLLYFSLFSFAACIGIKGELKGLYSFYAKTDKKFPGLVTKPTAGIPVCAIPRTELQKVIVTNGKDIKACMEQYQNSVLYLWSPKCHGTLCYSPMALQRICKEKGIELFIAAEYYDGEMMSKDYTLVHPIIGIDTEYYNTSLTRNYVSKFIWDLTGQKFDNLKFIQFKNGHFERMFSSSKQL